MVWALAVSSIANSRGTEILCLHQVATHPHCQGMLSNASKNRIIMCQRNRQRLPVAQCRFWGIGRSDAFEKKAVFCVAVQGGARFTICTLVVHAKR